MGSARPRMLSPETARLTHIKNSDVLSATRFKFYLFEFSFRLRCLRFEPLTGVVLSKKRTHGTWSYSSGLGMGLGHGHGTRNAASPLGPSSSGRARQCAVGVTQKRRPDSSAVFPNHISTFT
eukprot:5814288-Prymnesium_polylepis.1